MNFVPRVQFIGATDSAAPCAMLLDLAEAITPALEARKARLAAAASEKENNDDWDDDDDDFDEQEAAQTTLQFIFFDGEEAFHDWTATDSIYGSRYVPPGPPRPLLTFPALANPTQVKT